jgi:anhydro-N-acetylmuramic acid kinase
MVSTQLQRGITAIGAMSGTSLDGLDVCLCSFWLKDDKWHYTIMSAETYTYPAEIKEKLVAAPHMDALQFVAFHAEYGKYTGETIQKFSLQYGVQPALIASHGHTIFHRPEQGFTFQIGSGAHIAAATGINTVCDFRTGDVAMGGQGAPLVPIGDRLLFPEYDYCLNLGGFANISYEENGARIAFDICPVNYVLNHYIRAESRFEYDENGHVAASGNVNPELLDALNALDFYTQTGPKSLGREWVEQFVFPIIEQYPVLLADKLRTYCEHVAIQIGRIANHGAVLVTGGGTHHEFLLNRIAEHTKSALQIPETRLINYKEALIFAFLGVLYLTNQCNCLSSVTGAKTDVIGGALYKNYELATYELRKGKLNNSTTQQLNNIIYDKNYRTAPHKLVTNNRACSRNHLSCQCYYTHRRAMHCLCHLLFRQVADDIPHEKTH